MDKENVGMYIQGSIIQCLKGKQILPATPTCLNLEALR